LTFGRKLPIFVRNSDSGGLNMFRKLFYFLIFVAFSLGIWCAFALWTGIYSIYTYPPSRESPDGATLLVTREEGEPMFNSPHYTPPIQKPTAQSGIGFTAVRKAKQPLAERTIVRLPYIEWTYKKSLEPQGNSQ
jgi:hypothetical protein